MAAAARWAFAAFLTAALALPAHGQPRGDELHWDVRHALGGHHRTGSTIPVVVDLENPGATGRRLVVSGSAGGRQAAHRVELPAGSHKVVRLWLGPTDQGRSFPIVLEEPGGRLRLSHDLTSLNVARETLLVGIVGGHSMGWNALRAEGAVNLAHLRLEDLPTRAAGLRALDVLVWADPEPRRLDPRQVQAVASWLEGGGVLVLAVNDVWLDASLGSLAPWTALRPLGVVTRREAEALGEAVGVPFGPLDEPISMARLTSSAGESWVEETWGPLVVSEPRGVGLVYLLGFDPSERPVTRWAGMDPFWRALLTRAGLPPAAPDDGQPPPMWGRGGHDLEAAVRRSHARLEGIEPPPLGLLVLVLALYLLMIGPVDYLVLKKLDRLSWTWVTYPAIVAVFTLGTWAVARASKSGDPILQNAVVRDLRPESGLWAEESWLSLFAVDAGDYAVGLDGGDPLAVAPATRGGGSFAQQAFGGAIAMQGRGVVTARAPKWTTLEAGAVREIPARGAGLEASLDLETTAGAPLLRGRLTPHLEGTLQDARILVDEQGLLFSFALGDLPAEAPRSLESVRSERIRPESIPWNDPENLLEILQAQTGRGVLRESVREYLEDQNQSNDWIFFQLENDPHPQLDWSRHLRRGGAVLLGRLEGAGLSYVVEGADEVRFEESIHVRVPVPASSLRRLESSVPSDLIEQLP